MVAGVLPYCQAALFASTVLALLVTPALEALGACLLVLSIASLALPITAGADWMEDHRFATSFLVVGHLSYVVLLAASLGRLPHLSPRSWPRAPVVLIAALLVLAGLLRFDRLAIRDPIKLNEVTLARIGLIDGGLRWEHQMRLGVPAAVVLLPDAGGSLLVGGMQIVDNASLTDFQMARLDRISPGMPEPRQVSQYEHAERRPDLVDSNDWWPLDQARLGTDYLKGDAQLYARRDLVELDHIDPAAQVLAQDDHVQILTSPETVRTAAPGALVRCEFIVAWTDTTLDATSRLRASVAAGDDDELSLQPYRRPRSLGWRGSSAGR